VVRKNLKGEKEKKGKKNGAKKASSDKDGDVEEGEVVE